MAANDRTVVVTGGTSGLGFQLAAQLTRTGEVDVVLTGRSATTAQTVAARIGARGAALDLGSLASVHDFAAHVADLTGGRPLHALVANAGIQVSRASMTADGFETTFGVNHIGHVALVEDLLRLTGPPARLVLVTSGTHDPALRTGMPDPLEQATAEELAHPRPLGAGEAAGHDGRRRYATAKLANVRTAFELTRRLPGTQVYAFDPGLMPAPGWSATADRSSVRCGPPSPEACSSSPGSRPRPRPPASSPTSSSTPTPLPPGPTLSRADPGKPRPPPAMSPRSTPSTATPSP